MEPVQNREWIDEEAVTMRPAPSRGSDWGDLLDDDTDEEIVVVRRSPATAWVFGALAAGLGLGVIALVAASLSEPSAARAPIEALATADAVQAAPAEVAPPRVEPPAATPIPEIEGTGERKARRRVARASTARPPPMAVGALPALSVSDLPPAE